MFRIRIRPLINTTIMFFFLFFASFFCLGYHNGSQITGLLTCWTTWPLTCWTTGPFTCSSTGPSTCGQQGRQHVDNRAVHMLVFFRGWRPVACGRGGRAPCCSSPDHPRVSEHKIKYEKKSGRSGSTLRFETFCRIRTLFTRSRSGAGSKL